MSEPQSNNLRENGRRQAARARRTLEDLLGGDDDSIESVHDSDDESSVILQVSDDEEDGDGEGEQDGDGSYSRPLRRSELSEDDDDEGEQDGDDNNNRPLQRSELSVSDACRLQRAAYEREWQHTFDRVSLLTGKRGPCELLPLVQMTEFATEAVQQLSKPIEKLADAFRFASDVGPMTLRGKVQAATLVPNFTIEEPFAQRLTSLLGHKDKAKKYLATVWDFRDKTLELITLVDTVRGLTQQLADANPQMKRALNHVRAMAYPSSSPEMDIAMRAINAATPIDVQVSMPPDFSCFCMLNTYKEAQEGNIADPLTMVQINVENPLSGKNLCGHKFHKQCIETVLLNRMIPRGNRTGATEAACPLCRTPFGLTNLRRFRYAAPEEDVVAEKRTPTSDDVLNTPKRRRVTSRTRARTVHAPESEQSE